MASSKRKRLRSWRAAALFALAAAACGGAPVFNGEVLNPTLPAPEIIGTNWDGGNFLLSELQGKVAIVSFGYTYCPDVCPLTMAKMRSLYSRLGSEAEEVAFVFVSVDPERDSRQKLAEYIPAFDNRFYGLRLVGEQLTAVTEAYEVTVRHGLRHATSSGGESYNVDHTGTYFLIDRQGQLRVRFPPDASVARLLPDVLTLLEE